TTPASVILLEIDAGGVLAVEFECDAPRPIDVHRVAGRVEASQGMEVETGQVHVFRALGNIQTVKPDTDAFVHLGVDLGGLTRLEKVRQRLALERLDHGLCKLSADRMSRAAWT